MQPTANPAASSALAAALEKLWDRFLPEIRGRVAVLESATQSLAAGTLTAEQQQAAHAEAHKLAGVLGTFNLQRGTDLARDLESSYAEIPDRSAAPSLAQHASELRTLIDNRK